MLLCCLLGLAVLAQAANQSATDYYTIAGPITGLIATSEQLIVSTDSTLYDLATDLRYGATIDFSSEYESIAGVAAHRSKNNLTTIISCLAPGNTCAIFSLHNYSDFLSSNALSYTTGIYSDLVPLALVPTEGSCYAAGFGAVTTSIYAIANKIWITQFSYSDQSQNQQQTYPFSSDHHRIFLDGFEYNSNVYFVARDPDSANGLTVFQICKQHPLSALYEAKLANIPLTQYSTVVKVQLLQNSSLVSEDLLLLTVSDSTECSQVFAIKMSDIDKGINMVYDECVKAGAEKTLTPPWTTARTCKNFGTAVGVSRCDFNSKLSTIQALYVENTGPVYAVLSFQQPLIMTSSLVVEYNSTVFLYVAFMNSTDSFISKYLLTGKLGGHKEDHALMITPTLVSTLSKKQPVTRMAWASKTSLVYAATQHEVFFLDLDECSQHATCSQCYSTANPLCGWCTIENKCSMKDYCQNSQLSGRWIDSTQDCLDGALNDSMIYNLAIDNIQEIPLQISSGWELPVLSEEETYLCTFTNQQFSIKFEVPYVTNSCVISSDTTLPQFQGKTLDLLMGLSSNLVTTPFVMFGGALRLVNCSFSHLCSDCIESVTVCRWCAYEGKCTGNVSICLKQFDSPESVNLEGSDTSCPAIKLPLSGLYKLPATVGQDLVLESSHLPPEVGDYRYECELHEPGGAGLSTLLANASLSEDNLICNFQNTQVGKISSVTAEASLSVLLVSNSSSIKLYIEIFNSSSQALPLMLYNCTKLPASCSSCLGMSLQLQLELECGWCPESETCSTIHECVELIGSDACGDPIINYIIPKSGPKEGGTIITIYGSNLGVEFNDIASITIGQSSCQPLEDSYVPGVTVSCSVEASSTAGEMTVIVHIKTTNYVVSTASQTPPVTFLYSNPSITKINPLQGPVSGSTLVTISGTYLNSGNTASTVVTVSELICQIVVLNSSTIQCLTSPSMQPTSGLVIVIINNNDFSLSDTIFHYTPNPMCTGLYPNYTIPAGGVTLSFTGEYLDVILHPILSVSDQESTRTAECVPVNSTLIICIAPFLISTFTADTDTSPLPYNLSLESAPAVNSSFPGLSLSLRPNPIFTHINADDTQQTFGYATPIRIMGINIDSVLAKEIQVTVGGEACPVNSSIITPEIVSCVPLQPTTKEDKQSVDVVVSVAGGALIYTVGQLQFIQMPSTSAIETVITVSVLVVVMVMCICFLLMSVLGVMYWKKTHPPLMNLNRMVEMKKNGTIGSKADETDNEYTSVLADENLENIYESIRDPIVDEAGTIDIRIANRFVLPLASMIPAHSSVPALSRTSRVRPQSEVVSPTKFPGNTGFLHQREMGPFAHYSSSSPDIAFPFATDSTRTSQTSVPSVISEEDIVKQESRIIFKTEGADTVDGSDPVIVDVNTSEEEQETTEEEITPVLESSETLGEGEPHIYTKISKRKKSSTLLHPPAALEGHAPEPLPPNPHPGPDSHPFSPPVQAFHGVPPSPEHHRLEIRPDKLHLQDEYVSMHSASDISGHSPLFDFESHPKIPSEPYVMMYALSETSDRQPNMRKTSLPARPRESQYIAMNPSFPSSTMPGFQSHVTMASFPLAKGSCKMAENSNYVDMKSVK